MIGRKELPLFQRCRFDQGSTVVVKSSDFHCLFYGLFLRSRFEFSWISGSGFGLISMLFSGSCELWLLFTGTYETDSYSLKFFQSGNGSATIGCDE